MVTIVTILKFIFTSSVNVRSWGNNCKYLICCTVFSIVHACFWSEWEIFFHMQSSFGSFGVSWLALIQKMKLMVLANEHTKHY